MDGILVFLRDLAAVALGRRVAAWDLEALNDRQLADIGLDRQDIPGHVRSSRPWPPSPSGPRARLRPSLRGCG